MKFGTDGLRLMEELTRNQGWNCAEVMLRKSIAIGFQSTSGAETVKSNFSMDQLWKWRQTQKYIAPSRDKSLPLPR